MQTIIPKKGETLLHIETDLGVVNIYLKLHDRMGRRVETISILPSRYVGEHTVVRRGNRLVELKTILK